MSTAFGPRAIAWAGAVAFAASLLYFLFSYLVTFGEIAPGPLSVSAVAANAALFSVFALHHSLFARAPVRALMETMVSPALERSLYVWVASLMLIAVCVLWQPLPGVLWQVQPPVSWLLPVAQLAGAWLTLRSASVIDIWDLAGVRQTRETPDSQLPASPKGPADHQRPDSPGARSWELDVGRWEFKTTGPYGWVRHPIYLGWFLLVWPVATMTTTRLVFAVTSCLYVLIAIPLEERSLRRASGGAYEHYMRQVRWKLVPRVY